jgi:hypothetical protein
MGDPGRLYRLLLRLGPRRLRARHAEEMELLFLETLEHARARGRLYAAWAWLGAAWDLARATVLEFFRRHPRLPQPVRERQIHMIGTDLRYTMRWLLRQKLSTGLVVAMLSLGIAANVVVFGLVNGLFLRPFPFAAPDRLVYINMKAPRWNLEVVGINYPDFHTWREGVQLFDGIALYDGDSFNLSDGNGAERIDGAVVTYEFADVLGVRPILGRMFTADEDKPKAARVVVIGEGLWRERFGGADDVLGRTLKLNGVPHTIVGVLPAALRFPGNGRLWVPMAGNPQQSYESYNASGVARLKPGVGIDDGERDLHRAHEPIWKERDRDRVVSPFVRSLREELTRDFRIQATTLFGAVALLLVVACANVASVMLARALARRREMGIRLAVGARPGRRARPHILE